MLFKHLRQPAAQIVHKQRIQVHWRKVQLREGAAKTGLVMHSRAYREQNVRAVCAEAVRHLGTVDAFDGKIPPC